MRSKFRTVLVSFVVVLAMNALASSASAALPEFQKEGKQLKEAVKFTVKGGAAGFTIRSGSSGTCSSSSATGETKGSTEVTKLVITFAQCINGFPCLNTTEKGLVTKELKGRLGYLAGAGKPNPTVGLLLEPVSQPLAACHYHPTNPIEIRGSIIGQIGLLNKATSEFTSKYRERAKGRQEWATFEGDKVVHELDWHFNEPEGLGLETDLQITTEKKLEITA